MASHGIPRGQETIKSEKALQKEREDIEKYKLLVDQINDAVRRKDYSHQTLQYTTKLLKRNPEDYTTWNHRRRCLLSLFSRTEEVQSMSSNDLAFLLPLLVTYPKCYWIWNHRQWLLQQISERCPADVARETWEREIVLVGKMLARDSRNFHGWSYRRLIIAELRKLEMNSETNLLVDNTTASEDQQAYDESQQLKTEPEKASPTLTEQEFEYTTKMLRINLSNFSAWHNRSKLIPRLLDERRASPIEWRKLFDHELKKVGEALSIDPYDQSLWFYHHYLIMQLTSKEANCFGRCNKDEQERHLCKEIDEFKKLLEDFDDCKWILQNLIEHAVLLRELSRESTAVRQEDMVIWLKRLKKLDPLRRGRWDDLEKSVIN